MKEHRLTIIAFLFLALLIIGVHKVSYDEGYEAGTKASLYEATKNVTKEGIKKKAIDIFLK